jgi:hypothetical protein
MYLTYIPSKLLKYHELKDPITVSFFKMVELSMVRKDYSFHVLQCLILVHLLFHQLNLLVLIQPINHYSIIYIYN